MSLCTPIQSTIFWIGAIFCYIAGVWFVWRKYDLEKHYNLYLTEMQKKVDEIIRKDKEDSEFIRKSYEKARNGYLNMMKEIQSDDLPDPN